MVGKKVKFSRTRKVRVVQTPNDEEAPSVWYSRAEFAEIFEVNKAVVRVALIDELNSHSSHSSSLDRLKDRQDEVDYCVRGLEKWAKNRYAEKRYRTQASVAIVVREQRRLKEEGNQDPHAIAAAYREYAKPSKAEARIMGIRDEEAVSLQQQQQHRQRRRQSTGTVVPLGTVATTTKEEANSNLKRQRNSPKRIVERRVSLRATDRKFLMQSH